MNYKYTCEQQKQKRVRGVNEEDNKERRRGKTITRQITVK